MELKPIRAAAHRVSVAPEFGAPDLSVEGTGLTIAEIMAHPKLSDLAVEVWDTLQTQFAGAQDSAEGKAAALDRAYRKRLEDLVLVLETLLEETLDELERFDSAAPHLARTLP